MKAKRGVITAERYRRLRILNPIFAADNYVLEELATRFGVGVDVIIRDREYIHTVWWAREACEETIGEREKQAQFYKMLRHDLYESWKMSKKGKEKITSRFVDKECDECHGTGRLPQCKCLNCDGTGHVTEEVITREVDGSPGDVNYAREARACTDSICKLLGLNRPVVEKIEHHVDHEHKVSLDLSEKYRNADPEAVLAAKAAIARLGESAKSRVIEGTVVEKEDETRE
jgi:hypothetical protein